MLIGGAEVCRHWFGHQGSREVSLEDQVGISMGWKDLRSLRVVRRLPTNTAQEMGSPRRGLSAFHACCFLSFLKMQAVRVLRSSSWASTTS